MSKLERSLLSLKKLCGTKEQCDLVEVALYEGEKYEYVLGTLNEPHSNYIHALDCTITELLED